MKISKNSCLTIMIRVTHRLFIGLYLGPGANMLCVKVCRMWYPQPYSTPGQGKKVQAKEFFPLSALQVSRHRTNSKVHRHKKKKKHTNLRQIIKCKELKAYTFTSTKNAR